METAADRRRRKLKWLAEKHGLDTLADAAGLSAASLDQVLKGTLLPPKQDGTRSKRGLGDPAARAIEAALHLGTGWFDAPDDEAPPVPVGSRFEVDRDLLEVVIFQCVTRGSALTPQLAELLREAFDRVGLGREAADRLIKYTALMSQPSAPAPAADPATPLPPAPKRSKAAAGR